MTREIKFRAWDGKKMWSSVGFTDSDLGRKVYEETYMVDGGRLICNQKGMNPILMQYTGLKDKNGNEIFESDIVKPDETENYKTQYSIVKWIRGGFYLTWFLDPGNLPGLSKTINPLYEHINHITVIGNIHETPELLEETK